MPTMDEISQRLDVVRDFDCNRITLGVAVERLMKLGMTKDEAKSYLLG